MEKKEKKQKKNKQPLHLDDKAVVFGIWKRRFILLLLLFQPEPQP
jgi:hypothetical protein